MVKKHNSFGVYILITYTFSIIIGFLVFFPWGGLIAIIGLLIISIIFGPRLVFGRPTCSRCGGSVISEKRSSDYQIEVLRMTNTKNREENDDEDPLMKENFDKFLYKAELFLEAGRYEESLIYYKKLIAIKPEDITIWITMGQIYEKFGDFNNALESYRKALKIDPLNKIVMALKEDLINKLIRINKEKTYI